MGGMPVKKRAAGIGARTLVEEGETNVRTISEQAPRRQPGL
jgi:hypothetical protein